MIQSLQRRGKQGSRPFVTPGATAAASIFSAVAALVLPTCARASEADLHLPDLSSVSFHGITGRALLMTGLVICVAGLVFGLVIYQHLRKLPVHRAMLEVSELIYETCKTYLKTQIKFILILEAFIAAIIVLYFGVLSDKYSVGSVITILIFSLIGIAGSCSVAAFGIRINT